jgi:hypothetical protein
LRCDPGVVQLRAAQTGVCFEARVVDLCCRAAGLAEDGGGAADVDVSTV